MPGGSPPAAITALAARIAGALPQTQCTRCGYPDCAAYALAIARGQAPINQCPPGGAEGVRRLAALTGQAAQALSPEHGLEAPRAIAVIDEDWCIGCTLCIKACPADAILGLNKRMHTIASAHCSGCELCVPACPVDCIRMENASGSATGWAAWSPAQANAARTRYLARQQRLARQEQEAERALELAAPAPGGAPTAQPEPRQALIAAALARARAAKGH